MASGSSVKEIVKDAEFQTELVAAGNKLVVVDFFATWCAPCKHIAPVFAQLSQKYSEAVFLKVDVDVCRNTARRYEVASMPTFMLFKKCERIHTLKGADAAGLESAIIQHIESAGSQTESKGSFSIPGQINLSSLIDEKGSECLNNGDDHPLSDALSCDNDKYLESDCDEQLIISITFLQPVKLHSLQITSPDDGRAPKTVKVFINQPQTLDFDQAEQYKPVQELKLGPEDVTEDTAIPLQYVKFQNVQNITFFISDNQGDTETTVLQHLAFFGAPLDTTKMSEFKRVAGEKGERHA